MSHLTIESGTESGGSERRTEPRFEAGQAHFSARVNGTRADNPAKGIGIGDVVTVAAAHMTAVVRVLELGERRGPAPEARGLYAILSGGPSPEPDDGTA